MIHGITTTAVKPGQTWYVTIGRSAVVKTVKILEFTEKTILVMEVSKSKALATFGIEIDVICFEERYATDKVLFLERIKGVRK